MQLSSLFAAAAVTFVFAAQATAQGPPYEQEKARVAADPQYRALASAWTQCVRAQTTSLAIAGEHSDVGIVSRARKACDAAETALVNRLVAMDGQVGPRMSALNATRNGHELAMQRHAASVRAAFQTARSAQTAWWDCLVKVAVESMYVEASNAKLADTAVAACRAGQDSYAGTSTAALILAGKSPDEAKGATAADVDRLQATLRGGLAKFRGAPQKSE